MCNCIKIPSTKSTKIDPASVAVATLRRDKSGFISLCRDKQKYPNIHLRNIIYTPQVDILCPIKESTEKIYKIFYSSAVCNILNFDIRQNRQKRPYGNKKYAYIIATQLDK